MSFHLNLIMLLLTLPFPAPSLIPNTSHYIPFIPSPHFLIPHTPSSPESKTKQNLQNPSKQSPPNPQTPQNSPQPIPSHRQSIDSKQKT